jgi:uncharacterized protein YdcH (DUF465 family)
MPGMEQNTLDEIKAHLMQTSELFRDLRRQHHEYDKLVEGLESKGALTPQEEIEEHRLKKLKLHLKDQMEQMVSEYSLQQAAS